MSQARVRIGLIGAGGNTRSRHIPGFQAIDGVDLVTVANRSEASSAQVASEFGIPRTSSDWRAVIDDPEVDAVCIGTWPYTHAQMTIAALEAGKHVLCEARMAARSDEAREMLRCSRQHPGLTAQIVPAPHTLPLDQTIVELVGGGYIGDLISLDARIVNGNFPEAEGKVHWRHDRELSGNNVMNMGIWYEAVMRWVGPASSVSAVGQSVVAHRLDDTGRRVPMMIPDHIDVIGEMEQGGQMRFAVSSAVGFAQTEVYLFGTEGTLCVRAIEGQSLGLFGGRRADAGLAPIEIPAEKRGGWRVEEEFVRSVRGLETVTHTDFATGLRYMEWTDAVTRSLRGRRRVQLPLEVDGG